MNGSCLVYLGATTKNIRRLWCSAKFAHERADIHHIVQTALATRGSRWTSFAGSNREFAGRAAARPNTIIGLVTRAEKNLFPPCFTNVVDIAGLCAMARIGDDASHSVQNSVRA